MSTTKDDLAERVGQFQALELPGQPMMMHMGTFNLVNDLWREVSRLRELLESKIDEPGSGSPVGWGDHPHG